MVAVPVVPAAGEQALELFNPARRPANVVLRDGYIDLLGDDDPTGGHLVQRLMLTRFVPRIYERIWRPAVTRVLTGLKGPGRRGELRIAARMLALSSGDCVLDVGCGPGNFMRSFAEATGDGLVVGLDASRTMLAAGAAHGTRGSNMAYIRGDACALPFRASSFDAVCCFGALHLFEPPMQALDEMLRVLAPGGRVALMTTCDPDSTTSGDDSPVRKYGGMLMFARDEVTGALSDRGLAEIDQQVTGNIQFVGARRLVG